MSIDAAIRAETKKAEKFIREIGRQGVRRATQNGLNAMATQVRKVSRQKIAEERKIKPRGASFIRKHVDIIQRARPGSLRAIIQGKGGPLSLKRYGARQTRAGVTVQVRGKGRKLIRSAFGPGTSGKKNSRPAVLGGHVYTRKRTTRLPIKKLMGPGISTAFANRIVKREQNRIIREQWPRIMRDKVNDQIRKARAKAR